MCVRVCVLYLGLESWLGNYPSSQKCRNPCVFCHLFFLFIFLIHFEVYEYIYKYVYEQVRNRLIFSTLFRIKNMSFSYKVSLVHHLYHVIYFYL